MGTAIARMMLSYLVQDWSGIKTTGISRVMAPVTWVILSEIFPNQIRGAAMAIATFALWVGNALLAYFFPIINQAINASGSFWVFAGICIAGLIFVWLRLPETKGKTLEEIELHV